MISRELKSGQLKCSCGGKKFTVREWIKSDGAFKLKCSKCGEITLMKVKNHIVVEEKS